MSTPLSKRLAITVWTLGVIENLNDPVSVRIPVYKASAIFLSISLGSI